MGIKRPDIWLIMDLVKSLSDTFLKISGDGYRMSGQLVSTDVTRITKPWWRGIFIPFASIAVVTIKVLLPFSQKGPSMREIS